MNFHVYYDRSSKSWWAYRLDPEGNQIGDAVHGETRDIALIYLGMEWFKGEEEV